MTNKPSKTRSSDTANLICGLCMGCADVVPGVSGGTVALILGIYRRLVTAISRVDSELWRCVRNRNWRQAVEYLDVRFLFGLGTGIAIGVVGMSLLVNRLLNHSFTRSLTFAAFFGMILASAFLIGSLIKPQQGTQRLSCAILGLVAAAVALQLTMLPPPAGGGGEPSLIWLFCCGSVAICAMILPGISGAMILLVLGVYEQLTEIPKNLLAGQEIGASLLTLIVFGSGCALSLILFSKLLRWLLATYHAHTMSALCGFMFGALPKLWPFQRDTTQEIEKFKEKQFELDWPATFDGHVLAVLATGTIAMVLVFTVDRVMRRRDGTD